MVIVCVIGSYPCAKLTNRRKKHIGNRHHGRFAVFGLVPTFFGICIALRSEHLAKINTKKQPRECSKIDNNQRKPYNVHRNEISPSNTGSAAR